MSRTTEIIRDTLLVAFGLLIWADTPGLKMLFLGSILILYLILVFYTFKK